MQTGEVFANNGRGWYYAPGGLRRYATQFRRDSTTVGWKPTATVRDRYAIEHPIG